MEFTRIMGELWKNTSGKVGLSLLGLLVAGSLVVVFTYPPDFGTAVWGNPQVWADNPKSAPPAWVNWFSKKKRPPHRILVATAPSKVTSSARATEQLFSSHVDYSAGEPPQFLAVSVSDVTFQARPPILTASVVRPDGAEVILFREVASAPRRGESAPFRRFDTDPLRVVLSGNDRVVDELENLFATKYGVKVSRDDISRRPEAALFGVPVSAPPAGAGTAGASGGGTSSARASSAGPSNGRIDFRVLDGRYEFNLHALTADPKDRVGRVKTAVGGTVFGVMGTDALGRDLAVGLMYGLPVALLIGIATSIVSTLIGMSLGLVSGYLGGTTDLIIQRASDIVANVPVLPLLIFLVFIGGSQLWLILLVLVAFSWPGLTIMVRTMVLQLATGQEVEAARALGAGKGRIIFRHILPHVGSYVLAQLVFFAPSAILAEAGLSFLGLGDPSIPTWGQILEYGFRTGAVFLGYWWWIVPPGLMIVITAVTFMFLALGLEPIVDPRLRGRRVWRY